MLCTVPKGADIQFKTYRPGIETRMRRSERRDVENSVNTRDIRVTGTRVRAYENMGTGHWELWQLTKAGWEYITDWLGPNGELRYFSETGMRKWLYEHKTVHVPRFEILNRSRLRAKRSQDAHEAKKAQGSEHMRRSFDKWFGWHDQRDWRDKMQAEKDMRRARRKQR